MIELLQGMMLYHGSYCRVEKPDLQKCAAHKDFGRGFYLTTSPDQAKSFARLTGRKAISRRLIDRDCRCGYVNRYVLTDGGLRIHAFQTADAAWLHCVVGHRKENTFPADVQAMKAYDVIAGKIANDDTNATITAYMTSTFGEMGSKRADQICISLLIPERLVDQYCFRTEKALAVLRFEGSEEVTL